MIRLLDWATSHGACWSCGIHPPALTEIAIGRESRRSNYVYIPLCLACLTTLGEKVQARVSAERSLAKLDEVQPIEKEG